MPTIPQAVTRTPLHTRAVTYRGFARSDGLWDIEGRLTDTKAYPFERSGRDVLPAGLPIHDMFIRLTVDDSLVIREMETGMPSTPFTECPDAAEPMRQLIGATVGRGWRKAIDAAMGGTAGCTHLRELLFNMATAVIQTVPTYRDGQRKLQGLPPLNVDAPPHYIGQCMSWRRDGPIVQRIYPQFFTAAAVNVEEPGA